ncbi:programmed cell death 1 ligand 1-like isoform X2 [Channa argus]|uniref:programmed cell death 1 ligand 1-like isoform X2 n=1 Tax=Channa argus TaxID=215402 RepID=UPI00351F9EFE
MMIWTLLFIGLTSPIFGMFVVKRTSIHQTENNNITFSWDSQTKTDLSLTNLVCFFLSEPRKALYEMINGAEDPESQHQQFSGRVQLDRDALREGQIRLHLSTVTVEDSGNYRCDVAANYDQIMRRWQLEASDQDKARTSFIKLQMKNYYQE